MVDVVMGTTRPRSDNTADLVDHFPVLERVLILNCLVPVSEASRADHHELEHDRDPSRAIKSASRPSIAFLVVQSLSRGI